MVVVWDHAMELLGLILMVFYELSIGMGCAGSLTRK